MAGDDRTGGNRPAFVFGGGGLLGAAEVGMLRALRDAGVAPGLVVGTSVGAINGVVLAADHDGAADRLATSWAGIADDSPFGGSMLERVEVQAWRVAPDQLPASDAERAAWLFDWWRDDR